MYVHVLFAVDLHNSGDDNKCDVCKDVAAGQASGCE